MKKCTLSVLITVVMLISMLPTAVFAAETPYNLWVGGVQVTSANKDNIVVPGATGSATYDPDTYTLTLDNFSYTGQGYEYDSPWCAAIFSKNDLIVKVVGNNTITASVTDPYTAEALNVWGALTITGDSGSSLTLTGSGREGVDCIDDLKIENVTVNATGTSGLCSDEGITINNAIVNAVGNGDNAIYSTKAVSITNSSVTVTAPSDDGIFIYNSYENLTINNSVLTASVKSNGINVSMGSVHVTNSFIDITTTDGFAIKSRSGGGQKAISPYFTDGSDNYVVYAGDDAGSATEADASADATYANKYVKIGPVKYDLWVGGVQVTSANLVIDSTDSTAITGGSATYDPDTCTLTLDNFSYTGEGYIYDSSWCAAIFSKNDLIVKVVGGNTVIASVTDPYTAEALNVWGALTITGDTADNTDSVLKLTGCNGDGLFGEGVLTIENVTVKSTGVSGCGIYCENAVNINNAMVNIVSNNSQALYSCDAITINNSNVTVSSGAHIGVLLLESNEMNISNSTVEITAGSEKNAIYKGLVPDFGSAAVIVMAGDDAASATAADAKASETYKNRYIKIIPACTVTVNYGVDGVDNKEITVTKGDTISLENPVIDGYIFIGWFTDTTYQTAFDFTNPITANTTVYAKFVDYEGDKKALQDAIDDLETAVNNVETALNNKVSTDKLTEEVGKLNQAIADAKAYADTQDAALKASLEAADATMNTAINALKDRVTEIENQLSGIDLSQIATNKQEITDLTTELDAVKDTVDQLDNTFINNTELSDALGNLKAELDEADVLLEKAIQDVQDNLDAAKKELTDAIDALDEAMKKGDSDLAEEIKCLNEALINAENALKQADETNKAELTVKIDEADALLEKAIQDVQDNLDAAKKELADAIDALDTAMENGDADLSDKIAALAKALAKAQEELENTIADNKAALEAKIVIANTVIKGAVKQVQKNLDTAKNQLETAISDGDTSLSGKIAELNDALTSAQAALTAVDEANKAELISKIDAADATLDAAIKAVQKNLDDAKAELNKAIANGDTALDDKISALNEALATAKAVLEAIDAANKSELTTKIDEADAALQAAIDALSNELNTTNEKVAKLETFIIIVCVISGIAFCGCGTIAVFYIIDKKKKI